MFLSEIGCNARRLNQSNDSILNHSINNNKYQLLSAIALLGYFGSD